MWENSVLSRPPETQVPQGIEIAENYNELTNENIQMDV